ncbi:hypothetical protein NDU88_002707 [Pleurodeles waltl]|uniref:Uncharacterized protein n=1 Tax=Pleurodeles waltl TaxID=8319 RepID=A0AAV7M379_PLEWA|nr:hypothetical protein NDU88_002707 [Pleurodeles waltl]
MENIISRHHCKMTEPITAPEGLTSRRFEAAADSNSQQPVWLTVCRACRNPVTWENRKQLIRRPHSASFISGVRCTKR